MNCYRCKAQDRDYIKVEFTGARGVKARMELCDQCAEELREWLFLIPEGYAQQVRQLEAMVGDSL